MDQQEILTKLLSFKGNLKTLWIKKKGKKLSRPNALIDGATDDYSSLEDDLPLTLSRESGPGGITYYSTENSEFARGAPKQDAKGIDSFGEENTFDFEEADDYQTNRDRNQNSDLAKRYKTDGMNLDEFH